LKTTFTLKPNAQLLSLLRAATPLRVIQSSSRSSLLHNSCNTSVRRLEAPGPSLLISPPSLFRQSLHTNRTMATESTPVSSLLSLLYRSYPQFVSPSATETDLPAIAAQVFPAIIYNDADKAEISQWVATTSKLADSLRAKDAAATTELLDSLNAHLATRTTLLGAKPSIADLSAYALIGPLVEKWTPEERTGENGHHHIVRYVDFVQNADLFGLKIPDEEKIAVDVDDVRAPAKMPQPPKQEENKEKKKKMTREERLAAAAARGQGGVVLPIGKGKSVEASPSPTPTPAENSGKEAAAGGAPPRAKKEKAPKQPKAPPPPAAPPSPALIDLRVGHILRAINHPNADSLYVSTIACGDAPGAEHTSLDEETGLTVRTVCSGLNGLVPLAEMQNRKVVTVCNLKPVTMRGIKSAAMVLAASPRDAEGHGGPVELVNPPEGAEAGERVFFEGFSEGQPEKVLNPKKKVWETFQPGFTTTESLEVAFNPSAVPQLKEGESSTAAVGVGKLVTQSGGVCTVKSLKGATVR
jgi:aminoacyl tRNA synthase complex-interacting multifunctional protein 1